METPLACCLPLCQHFTSYWWQSWKHYLLEEGTSTLPPEVMVLPLVPPQHISAKALVWLFSSHGYFQICLIRQTLSLVYHQCQVYDKYSFSVSWITIIEFHLVQLQLEHLQADTTTHLHACYCQSPSPSAGNLLPKPSLLDLKLKFPGLCHTLIWIS